MTKLLEDAAPDDEARATLETLLASGAAAKARYGRRTLDIATPAPKISDDRRFDALLDSAAAALDGETRTPSRPARRYRSRRR